MDNYYEEVVVGIDGVVVDIAGVVDNKKLVGN